MMINDVFLTSNEKLFLNKLKNVTVNIIYELNEEY
jgi:hypothetical protein